MLTGPVAADPGEEGETGNVALTALALMVVTLLTVAMFLGAQRSLLQGRLDTEAGRADAAAELAVSEAFARIDRGATARFAATGTIGETDYAYTAEPVDPSTWSVRAEATAGRTARAVTVTIGREARYPHTIFAVDEFIANRNTGTIAGRVGTNGTMTVTGLSPGTVQELYRPDGECRGCGNPLALDGPRRLDPVGTPSGPAAPCPLDGRFVGTVDGGGGTPVLCTDPAVAVVFEGDVVVSNPPLVVYVGREVALTLDGATVNRGGSAADVRLLVAGQPADLEAEVGAIGADVTGFLYGPGRSLTATDTAWTGSMTLHRVEVVRNGRLSATEDPAIGSLGDGRWRMIAIRSTPSGQ